MHTISHWLPRALLALALLVATGAASAGGATAATVPTVRVDAAGLNLKTQEGVAVLYGRIRLAAREVCRAYLAITGTRVPAVFARCVRDAVDRAVYSWRLPMLATLHDELGADRLLTEPPRRKTII